MKEKAEDQPGRVHFEDPGTVKLLFGENDTHLKLIEKSVGVKIHARGNTVSVSGDPIKVQLAEKLLIELYDLVRRGHPLYPNDIVSAVRILSGNHAAKLKDIFLDTVYISARRRLITPKSLAQKRYIDAIRTVANLVFPVLLYVAVSVAANGELVPGPTRGMVSPGSPAAAAGLAPGDRIVAVTLPTGEVRTARWFSELRELVAPHPGRTLVLQIGRDGARLPPISVVPAPVRETNQIETVVRGVLGVGMEHPPALVAPVGPSPVRPLDLVVKADGREIRHLHDLRKALAAASCGPIDLEVLREVEDEPAAESGDGGRAPVEKRPLAAAAREGAGLPRGRVVAAAGRRHPRHLRRSRDAGRSGRGGRAAPRRLHRRRQRQPGSLLSRHEPVQRRVRSRRSGRRRGAYLRQEQGCDGILKSRVFPGLWLDVAALLRGDPLALRADVERGCAEPAHAAFVQRLARGGTG